MRIIGVCFLLIVAAFVSGCVSQGGDLKNREQVLYYDRNGDGRVDLEWHHYPGAADADWELKDGNYDGRYDKKIMYGFAVTESTVDLPVPTGVRIEKSVRSNTAQEPMPTAH